MKDKTFRNYYICLIAGVMAASFYPLYMGIKVAVDMISEGVVIAENYPKYIIPYTPISIALITGVLLMPLLIRTVKKLAFWVGAFVSLVTFFVSEIIIENMVIVEKSLLRDWQMYMCAFQEPEGYKIKAGEIIGLENDVLMILSGEYNPLYKLHFYLISAVVIVSLLNCIYGFGQMIKDKDKSRLKTLVLQAISAVIFTGLCIFACFTAFYRTGNLYVSSLSAFLMGLYFIIFGVTMGIFTGSFLFRKNLWLAIAVPSIVAVISTILMYIGEMILLGGEVYRFGKSPFSNALSGIAEFSFVSMPLAPIDIMIILLSGCITMLIMSVVVRFEKNKQIKSE